MTKNFHSDIIDVRGDDYSRGVTVGRLFRRAIRRAVRHADKNTAKTAILQRIATNIKNNFPYIHEEVRGRADGAGVAYLDFLGLACYELDDVKTEHCTTIMVNTKHHFFLAHNEDGDYHRNDVHLVQNFFTNGNQFYELACMGSLATNTIRVGHDFIYTTNYVGFADYNFDYLPRTLFMRVLAECKTVEELIATFRTTPLASATHVNLVDFKNKKMYSMEKALDKASIKEINGTYIHANHLIHEPLLGLRPPLHLERGNTHQRQYAADVLLNGRKDLTIAEAKDILTYYNTNDFNSVFCKMNCGNDCLTFGTYIFDPAHNANLIEIYCPANKQTSATSAFSNL